MDEARALIAGHRVRVGGAIALKATRQVAGAEPVVVDVPPRYVSRAGHKLEGALDRFGIDVAGRTVLDVGASTGGFTDCLLQRGAAHVHAVDVGTNQLHERCRDDPRVTVRERTDIRSVTRAEFEQVDLVGVDVSFVSLTGLAGALVRLAGTGGELVVLVKPQFEATRLEADRGAGVITDPEVWRRVLTGVAAAFEAADSGIMGVMVSPLRGASGNTEFFLHLHAAARAGRRAPTASMVSAAVLEASR